MIDDEFIPTSDPEEEEEFRANQAGYWEAIAAARVSRTTLRVMTRR